MVREFVWFAVAPEGRRRAGRTIRMWSIPWMWIWATDYSENIGNTFAPNGFSVGSSRHVWSAKQPKSYCMKVTSQMCSPTCVTPTFCPVKT